MNSPQFTIKQRLISNWLNDFDYENYEVIKCEQAEIEAGGQNPFGVVKFDIDIAVQITGVGKRIFQLRFARSGNSFKFHLVFERLLAE